MRNAKRWLFYAIGLSVCLSGCSMFSYTVAPVAFDDPYTCLGIQPVEPTDEESSGISLRYQYPKGGMRTYREELVLFNAINRDSGKKRTMLNMRQDRYMQGTRDGVSLITSETVYDGEREKLYTTLEADDRGAIVAFHEGRQKTSIGQVSITEWQRSAVFPRELVSIGDEWTYEEHMAVAFHSRLIRGDMNAMPVTVSAKSTLKGVAVLQGRRCAVIETEAVEERQYHLKVLFLPISFTMMTRMRDTVYFDYSVGEEIARVTRAHVETTHGDGRMLDVMEVQGLSVMEKDNNSL